MMPFYYEFYNKFNYQNTFKFENYVTAKFARIKAERLFCFDIQIPPVQCNQIFLQQSFTMCWLCYYAHQHN